jgi:site-specific DNA-methyltransferase (adenine-specific)
MSAMPTSSNVNKVLNKPMINLMQGDCFERMKEIESGSVDMVICDLPYGTTFAAWDSVIPLEPLWEQYERIIKHNGAFVLFGSQPFSARLINSNLKLFKYEWIWEKGRASGHVHAKNKPLKAHENILVFSKGTTVHKNQSKNRMTYVPQLSDGKPYTRKHISSNVGSLLHSKSKANTEYEGSIAVNEGFRYPRSVLKVKNHNVGNFHPTQKPTELCEYLIKTYTNSGDVVLDNCMGSGTTGVAAVNTGRKFIGIELDEHYFNIAKERIEKARQAKEAEYSSIKLLEAI